MEIDLKCNGCRKIVKNIGWVTTCSHFFCDEDGQAKLLAACTEVGGTRRCPACDTELSEAEFLRVDLKLSDNHRSLILAAQRPDTIVDVCSRAMQFFVYQVHQELAFSSYCVSKMNETVRTTEQQFQTQLIQERNQSDLHRNETQAVKQQLNTLMDEYNLERQRNEELADRFAERNREYKRLQTAYDELKRKMIVMPASIGGASGDAAMVNFGAQGAVRVFPNRDLFQNSVSADTNMNMHLSMSASNAQQNASTKFAMQGKQRYEPMQQQTGAALPVASKFAYEQPLQYPRHHTPMQSGCTPKQMNDTPSKTRNVFINNQRQLDAAAHRPLSYTTQGDIYNANTVTSMNRCSANFDPARVMSATVRSSSGAANRSFLG